MVLPPRDFESRASTNSAIPAGAVSGNYNRVHLSDFDYELPPELIAQHPAAERAASRLLHLDGRTGAIEDRRFRDIVALLEPGDVLVFNDTRVIKARLHGRKDTGGEVEVLVERVLDDHRALAQVRASKAPKAGRTLILARGVEADVLGRHDEFFELRFERAAVLDVLAAHGEVPLPPYITHAAVGDDEARYQTVYAREPGAVAAPTAGLHFDEALLAALAREGRRDSRHVTLHVGAGTFQPVRVDDVSQHVMHSEWYSIPEATVEAIARGEGEERARRRGRDHDVARARIGRDAAGGEARGRCSRNAALHHAGLPVPRGRPADHQFPPAALDAAHAGVRLRGHRQHPPRLRARRRRALPLLQLRRRDAARAGQTTQSALQDSESGLAVCPRISKAVLHAMPNVEQEFLRVQVGLAVAFGQLSAPSWENSAPIQRSPSAYQAALGVMGMIEASLIEASRNAGCSACTTVRPRLARMSARPAPRITSLARLRR